MSDEMAVERVGSVDDLGSGGRDAPPEREGGSGIQCVATVVAIDGASGWHGGMITYL
jgi:hypothetical protein